MNTMLCGYKDDPRQWESPETKYDQPDDVLSDVEKRLEWICNVWADALAVDTDEEWADVGSCIYGATQASIWADSRHEDVKQLNILRSIAFQNRLDCITRKYGWFTND